MKHVVVGLLSLAFVGTAFVELAPEAAAFKGIRRAFRRVTPVVRRPVRRIIRRAPMSKGIGRAFRRVTRVVRRPVRRPPVRRAAPPRRIVKAPPKPAPAAPASNLPTETVAVKPPDEAMKKEIKLDVKSAVNKALSKAKSATQDPAWQKYFREVLGK